MERGEADEVKEFDHMRCTVAPIRELVLLHTLMSDDILFTWIVQKALSSCPKPVTSRTGELGGCPVLI